MEKQQIIYEPSSFFHDTELTPGQQDTSEELVSTLPGELRCSIT